MANTPKKSTPETVEKKKKPAAAASTAKKATAKKKPSVKKAPAKAKAATVNTAKSKPAAQKKKASTSKTSKTENVKSRIKQEAPNAHNDEQHQNTTRPTQGGDAIAEKLWRLVGMVAFAMIANFTLFALLILAAMQYVVSFISEKPNEEIRMFMSRLTRYFDEIFSYMSFQSDDMPFPFKEFPDGK